MAHCRVPPSLRATRSPYTGRAAASRCRGRRRGRPGRTGQAHSPPRAAGRRRNAAGSGFRAAEKDLVARQLLGRGFRRVAAQPGERHLIAVDGLRFGPDHRRQGTRRRWTRPRTVRLMAALRRTARRMTVRRRIRTGMCRTTAGRLRRQAAPRFRCRPRGRTPAAAARCQRRPTAVPCRRRPWQRPRGAGCRCSREPPPARQRSRARVRQTVRRTNRTKRTGWRGLPGRSPWTLHPTGPEGFRPVPGALVPGLSARSQSARRRDSRHRPKCPDCLRGPLNCLE